MLEPKHRTASKPSCLAVTSRAASDSPLRSTRPPPPFSSLVVVVVVVVVVVAMGDREPPQFNRLLFARFAVRAREVHEARLRGEIKAVIDTAPPPIFAHLADRRKVKQKWTDEQTRIEYENMVSVRRETKRGAGQGSGEQA